MFRRARRPDTGGMRSAVDTRTQVFIVEDSPMVRKRLVAMMDETEGVSVVGEADTEKAAVEGILRTRPDWVLLDVQLTDGNGIEVLRQVRKQVPDTGFIVLTNFNTPQYRRVCIQEGASHFLDKMQVSEIKEIVAGPKYSRVPVGPKYSLKQ
jgi:DNA-binding NarL/FixJ family response regulator